MKILGIESSCDETAVGIVEDGRRVLAHAVAAQIDIHKAYGGVVPEIAARSHLEAIHPVLREAFSQSALDWHDIDAVAVTYAPGLSGSLLVGALSAQTLALLHNKPLFPVHHVEAHVYANFITGQAPGLHFSLPASQPKFPFLALIVSGNHSQLALFHDHGKYELLGQTQDDAVGEAFDKVAKMLGLPYPGGPSIEHAAVQGNPLAYDFPIARMANPYDFSFSGLKTAVLRAIQRDVGKDFRFPSHALSELLTAKQKHDFAASFLRVAIETLVSKTEKAFHEYAPASVIIAGGVASSPPLRHALSARLSLPIEYAPRELCTDNGVMVAALAYYQAQRIAAADPHHVSIVPSISMTQTAWNMGK